VLPLTVGIRDGAVQLVSTLGSAAMRGAGVGGRATHQHEHLDGARAQRAAFDHVEHAPGRAAHHVAAVLQLAHVLADALASDAAVRLPEAEATRQHAYSDETGCES
jgi:hypothetical protein